jgi:hypothetical protein
VPDSVFNPATPLLAPEDGPEPIFSFPLRSFATGKTGRSTKFTDNLWMLYKKALVLRNKLNWVMG